MPEDNFNLIRPYTDEEMQAAIPRIVSDAGYNPMMNFLFTEEEKNAITKEIGNAKTINDFQKSFTLKCINAIVEKTAKSNTCSGLENIDPTKSYLFMGNHRDIALDSSILGQQIINEGITPPSMTWGNNLEVSPFIVDLGKSNQMITVFRDGSPKEILRSSQRLSLYINKMISSLERSIWIAQSKGRTKDGRDHTDPSILKMLILSGDRNIKQAILDLNIIPVTISYELEPCGGMKVREVFLSQQEKYVKDVDEDLHSILGGFMMQKGGIHLAIGTPINDLVKNISDNLNNNETLHEVANIIDLQTHKNYKLWPTNYLAYDLLEKGQRFEDTYDNKTKEDLEARCQLVYDVIDGDKEELRRLFYLMYANPVYSKIKGGFL